MSYGSDDLRSTLAAVPSPGTAGRAAQYYDFSQLDADDISERGSRTWIVRSESLLLLWTEAVPGDSFALELSDESVLLVPEDSVEIRVSSSNEAVSVNERAFISVPAGLSEVTAVTGGPVLRIASAQNSKVAPRARNAGVYETRDPVVAPWAPWPLPRRGSRLSAFRLDDWPVEEGRFGRIFRNSTTMVNFLPDEDAPRDPQKLSPHHHDDFEQLSICTRGRYRHHLRYPWGPDGTSWRADEHVEIGSPSVAIIPPPVIHTSEGLGHDQRLVDVFGPPRRDFSDAGWVINDEDAR